MKIILSPSKTQKRDPGEPVDPGALLNQEKTLALFSRLQGMSLKELEKALSVKGSLAEETFRLYQEHRPEKPGFAALDCYEGRAFQALEERCPSPQGKARGEKHLVILSAMYGLVTPGTRIWPIAWTLRPGSPSPFSPIGRKRWRGISGRRTWW